jgi:hypothetical protein
LLPNITEIWPEHYEGQVYISVPCFRHVIMPVRFEVFTKWNIRVLSFLVMAACRLV